MPGMIAILCSGQGGQHPEMFSLVADHPAAASVFSEASDILGFDPREWVKSAEHDEIYSNRAGQILCCTLALAVWAVIRDVIGDRRVLCAGYSVGELAAWGIAGCLTTRQVLELAGRRAALMDHAAPSGAGLAGIAGLSADRLDRIVAEAGVSVAISNGPGAAVVGGLNEAVDRAVLLATAAGAATARRLNVAVPSHTPLLADAVSPFHEALCSMQPKAPRSGSRLLSGLDGEPVFRIAEGCDRLARQIGTTIHWDECLQACDEAIVSCILETGPGKALMRMASSTLPQYACRSVEDFHSLHGLGDWIKSK